MSREETELLILLVDVIRERVGVIRVSTIAGAIGAFVTAAEFLAAVDGKGPAFVEHFERGRREGKQVVTEFVANLPRRGTA